MLSAWALEMLGLIIVSAAVCVLVAAAALKDDEW